MKRLLFLLTLYGSLTTACSQDSATVVCEQFLYEQASFPSCHASTIVETQQGNLVCAYFGGTHEGNPDVGIWVSIKAKGENQWQEPILADDGVIDGEPTACWNPVLFEMPDGELWLFYKIAKTIQTWKGYLKKSLDGGRTWSEREALPENFLGPIKNKPILLGDRLLCGSSTEVGGWRFHVEILDLKTGQWRYIGPVTSTTAIKTDDNQPHPIDCIQPSFLQLKDGRLQVLMRTHNGVHVRRRDPGAGPPCRAVPEPPAAPHPGVFEARHIQAAVKQSQRITEACFPGIGKYAPVFVLSEDHSLITSMIPSSGCSPLSA